MADRILFDDMWARLWAALWPYATDEIKDAYTNAAEDYSISGGVMYLSVPRCVKMFIEENMDIAKPIMWPFMQKCGCRKLIYKIL